jgi:RNA polymerase sigma factor (TIGR02999 family)
MPDVIQLLEAAQNGDSKAASELLPLVYTELRRLAVAHLEREKPGQTLQATGLVHEAYLRLVGSDDAKRWNSRGHFFGAAAEAMRRILIEQARSKLSQKRGAAPRRCELSENDRIDLPLNDEIIDLDLALTKLAGVDPEAAEVVKLRVFAGMTIDEVAEIQDVSARTIKRHWSYARAWLGRELVSYDGNPS